MEEMLTLKYSFFIAVLHSSIFSNNYYNSGSGPQVQNIWENGDVEVADR